MFRRVTLALALVSVLTGCVATPPKGALVEYREGLTPITRPVKCPATYVLCGADQPGAAPLAEYYATKGERIGFRREEDGSVSAVAPGYALALQPGAYSWEVVRESVAPWKMRAKEELCGTAKTVGLLMAIVALLGFGMLVEDGEDSTPKPGPGEPDGVILRGHPHTKTP